MPRGDRLAGVRTAGPPRRGRRRRLKMPPWRGPLSADETREGAGRQRRSGRRRHPCGEGRGVQFVIGEQDERPPDEVHAAAAAAPRAARGARGSRRRRPNRPRRRRECRAASRPRPRGPPASRPRQAGSIAARSARAANARARAVWRASWGGGAPVNAAARTPPRRAEAAPRPRGSRSPPAWRRRGRDRTAGLQPRW